MEKVKVTREQVKALSEYKHNKKDQRLVIKDFIDLRGQFKYEFKPLNDLSVEQFALLLCGWYEVEEEFKVGQWVYSNNTKEVFQINITSEFIFNKFSDEYSNLRHATPEEIAQEKERRWWKLHGRGVRELKPGDILISKKSGFSHVNETDTLLNSDKFKIACFKENRLDGN